MYLPTDQTSLRARVYIVGDGTGERDLFVDRFDDGSVDVVVFDCGEEFLAGVQWDAPAAVVAGLDLADMSAFALLGAMRRRGRVLPLILITADCDAACAVQALRLGVFDLFHADPEELEDLSMRLSDALRIDADRLTRRRLLMRANAAVSALSARERQVMELVVAGAANKVIASDLGISEKTVEAHRGKVMRKMQVDSLAELVRVNVILEEVGRRDLELRLG